MRFTRMVITAHDDYWLSRAIEACTGYGTSVISCDAEIAVESYLTPEDTADGRIGVSILAFGFSTEALEKAMIKRVGQCVMTCPTTAVFDGLPAGEKRIPLGKSLRYFGDGFQKSKLLDERRFWRIPVMEGEFIVESTLGVSKGVAGGNFLIQASDVESGLAAARRATEAIAMLPDVITPFPGGVVRSGSKVGSRYASLRASTYDAFCPTLRGRVESRLAEGAHAVYEIVIDGTDFDSVATAIKSGILASLGEGVVAISAGNYGGKLGKHHYYLQDILGAEG